MVWHGKRTARTALVAIGLGLLLAAVPTVVGAAPALGVMVSANPANFTPNVASGAVYKFVQANGTMYAGGAFGSVSTAPASARAAPSPATTSSPSTRPAA